MAKGKTDAPTETTAVRSNPGEVATPETKEPVVTKLPDGTVKIDH